MKCVFNPVYFFISRIIASINSDYIESAGKHGIFTLLQEKTCGTAFNPCLFLQAYGFCWVAKICGAAVTHFHEGESPFFPGNN